LAEIGEEYEVDPVNDLIPICPNCHAMIHKKVPAFSIEELRAKIQR
jgi:5-methylcytosine-specific restriction protein A